MSIEYVVLGLVGAFGAGYFAAVRAARLDVEKKAEDIYQHAKALVEAKDFLGAISVLGKLNGMVQIVSGHHLLGLCFSALGEVSRAAEAYSTAAFYAYGQGNPDGTLNYRNAVLSFFKQENWEFVIERARVGAEFSQKYPQGRFYKERDLEADIRAMKILASIRHFTGTMAFEAARADAQWILKNSDDKCAKGVASDYLQMKDVVLRKGEMLLAILGAGHE